MTDPPLSTGKHGVTVYKNVFNEVVPGHFGKPPDWKFFIPYRRKAFQLPGGG